MFSYVAKRLAFILPTILIVLTLNFFLLHAIPGDLVQILAGDMAPTPELRAYINSEWGLDKPILTQYSTYMQRSMVGDLGRSMYYGSPVLQIVSERAFGTALLVGVAVIVSFVAGVLLALVAAVRRDSKVGESVMILSLMGYSIPLFWLGQLLVLFFAVLIPIFPATGMLTAGSEFTGMASVVDLLRHLILPVTTLALVQVAVIARIGRAKLVEILDENFIIGVRAKGVEWREVIFRHALKNALVVIVTLIGMRMAYIISASAVVETIFGWPGLGSLLIFAIARRDYTLVLGTFYVYTIIVVVAVLLTEILYTRIDPRISFR